jgi:hypothetical protein
MHKGTACKVPKKGFKDGTKAETDCQRREVVKRTFFIPSGEKLRD